MYVSMYVINDLVCKRTQLQTRYSCTDSDASDPLAFFYFFFSLLFFFFYICRWTLPTLNANLLIPTLTLDWVLRVINERVIYSKKLCT